MIIAGTYDEAHELSLELLRENLSTYVESSSPNRLCVRDAITGARGDVQVLSAHLAIRALDGARPDIIIIAGDYLRWRLAPGKLSELWWNIQRTALMRPGLRVVFR